MRRDSERVVSSLAFAALAWFPQLLAWPLPSDDKRLRRSIASSPSTLTKRPPLMPLPGAETSEERATGTWCT